MPGPLNGVRVVDLTTVMYGPYCTQLLADYGADVVKVEPPGGDISRQVGTSRNPGMSAAVLGKARNKRSIVLDLKREEARRTLHRLVRTADVLVHNMRPKPAARLGLSYGDIARHRPDIVHCAAVGFGPSGPYADKPAYDDLIQGVSGLAWLEGARSGGEPHYAPSVLADKTSGLFAASAILMALYHRARTGEGQAIDCAMFETFTSFVMAEHMQGRAFDPPTGPAGYPRLLTPWRRPHRTADGHVCVLPYSDRHWRGFFALAGRPELADDPRFADMPSRGRNIDALYTVLADIMASRSSAEWLSALEDADIPAMPMHSPESLFEDPHLQAVGFFRKVDHPTEGRTIQVRPPVEFSRTPGELRRHAPHAGEHSGQILREAGLDEDEIAGLFASGAVEGRAGMPDG